MPIYQQLEEQLISSIKEGRLKPGTTLPAERYLAEIARDQPHDGTTML